MERFRTPFVALPGEEHAGRFNGAGWSAVLRQADDDAGRVSIVGGRAVDLYAGSWAAAQRAVDLINGSRVLMNGDPDLWAFYPIAYNEAEPAWMEPAARTALGEEQLLSQSGIPTACAIAARASRRRRWAHAVARYKFSLGLFSVHHMDMHPNYRTYHGVSRHPDDHVLLAQTLVAAFAVVEDLGLAVPAGPGRPSRLGGVWNPVVLRDLEQRLAAQHVDPADTVLWLVRGPSRRIERRRPLPNGTPASWTGGSVRDRRLPVVDAIAHADYLRDRVAAHGARDVTRSLTPYDVVNVQALARFLLLTSLGFRVWETGVGAGR